MQSDSPNLGVDKCSMTHLHLWLTAGIDNRIHICLLIAVVLCVCVVQILIEEPREACRWKCLHIVYIFRPTCTLFTFSVNIHIVHIFRPTCTLFTFSGQHAHCSHFQANMHIVHIFRPTCTLFTFSGQHAHCSHFQANMHIVYIFRPTCTLFTFSGQHAHCSHFQANMHIVHIFRPLCLFGLVPLCSNTDRRTTWMWCGMWL